MAIKKKAKTAAKKVKKAAKSAARKVKAAVKRSRPKHSGKQVFLYTYAREHATTLRVLRAFPPGTSDFRPHERSQSVSELAYTLLFEQELKRRALVGPVMGAGGPPPKPANFEAAILQFDDGYKAIVDQIEKMPDSKLDRDVQFPTAKGMMGSWRVLEFLWFMLHDQIHHRGQLSVMVRMAGGKVPSIYGPSGDEPWN